MDKTIILAAVIAYVIGVIVGILIECMFDNGKHYKNISFGWQGAVDYLWSVWKLAKTDEEAISWIREFLYYNHSKGGKK